MVVSNTMAATAVTSEKSFIDGKSDLYEGHKVVAMPSSAFGGKSVRDVVTSRNTDYRNTTPTRRRSRSIGRSPVSRSRDIVQDVYNRIGVNYIRGRPSIENILDDSPIVTLPQSGNQEGTRPTSRGRPATRVNDDNDSRGRSEQVSEDVSRSRSLSRGRVASRWPHERLSALGSSSNQPTRTSFNHTQSPVHPTLGASPQPKERSSYGGQRWSTSQPANPTYGSLSAQDDKKKRQSYPDTRDDQVDEDTLNQEEQRDCVSVKDRISAYGPSAKAVPNSRVIRRSYNNQFSKRDHPPKVDIYGSSNGSIDCQGERDAIVSLASAGRSVDASEANLQNSRVNEKKRFSSANSISQRSVRSGIADAFLAAISPNKAPQSPIVSKNIPMVEIPSEELNVNVDAASLAASSVSGEDFNPSPRKRGSKSFGGLPKFGGNGNISGLPSDKLERYIDDRVHAQVQAVTKSMEARFEQAYKRRIEELEKQTDRLSQVVSQMR